MAGALTAAIAAAFAGGVTPDPYFNYTTLLLPGSGTNGAQNNTFLDGSTNNFTITRNGNTTQGTFSPFSQTGWGGYAFVTGQYLTAPGNAAFAFTTNNWTVEAWIYPTALNTYNFIYTRESSTNLTSEIEFSFGSNGTLTCAVFISSTQYTAASSTGAIVANRWQHVAAVRNGGTLTIYVDGTSVGSNATLSTSSINDPGTGFVPNILNQAPAANRGMQGYCSNFRLAIGVAVYTGAFTPPTTPLAATQSSSTNISAITGTQTKILTFQSNRFVDNSVANSGAGWTLTVNGSLSVQAFSPFNPTASWSAATNGGSGYFDGSGDYLSIPNSTSLQLGSADWDIECWVYINSTSGTQRIISQSDSNYEFAFYMSSGALTAYSFQSGGTQNFAISMGTLSENRWYHIATTRSGSTVRAFVDGAQVGSATFSGTIDARTGGWKIGASYTGSENFNGYVSNARIVKGTAVYTSTFTPSTTPLTAITNTSLLLNFTNAGIYDATSKNVLETVDGAQISNAVTPQFGSTSIKFDGTGDWLLMPDQPQQRIGTGNFTIEMWVYRNSSGTYGLAGKGTGTTGWLVSLNSSNQVVFTYGSSTITSSGTVSATTWTHIAVVREGTSTNQTKIYINGTNDGTGTVSTDFNQTNSMYIGADRTGGSAANAYVQDVRITNYARYTTNFAPGPTAAFPTL